jgi:hypothetical protein
MIILITSAMTMYVIPYLIPHREIVFKTRVGCLEAKCPPTPPRSSLIPGHTGQRALAQLAEQLIALGFQALGNINITK